jgi:hypothetical protein
MPRVHPDAHTTINHTNTQTHIHLQSQDAALHLVETGEVNAADEAAQLKVS